MDTTNYAAYLGRIRDRLPPGARAYAEAPWHYDFLHERCPHDANLLNVSLTGSTLPESSESRQPGSLELRLIGSHRDGILHFSYSGLRQMVLHAIGAERADEFGDVLVDEISLSETGLVLHEVVFENTTLLIEAADVVFRWEPITR